MVKESFAHIEPKAEKATAYFYGRLFAEDPRLRALFPPALGGQGERLFRALAQIVWSLDSPDTLAERLGRVGRDHRRFGLLPEHYRTFGRALLAALRRFAGDTWTPEAGAAWSEVIALATKIMIDAAQADQGPPWWVGEVLDHDRRAPDLAVLTVSPSQPLPYRAGQYILVQTARWPRVWRPYSVANAPRPDGLLRLHVRARPAGWVSGALVRYTKVGDTVLLGAAAGTMTIEPGSDRALVLVAGGTGLGPIKALAEQAVKDGGRRDILLVCGARTGGDLYDLADLRVLEASCPRLRIVPVVSADPGFDGARGLVPDALDRFAPFDDHDVYVAGPPGMITGAVTRLHEMGVPAERIHHDPLPDGPESGRVNGSKSERVPESESLGSDEREPVST